MVPTAHANGRGTDGRGNGKDAAIVPAKMPPEPHLYYWRSGTLKEYGDGHIFVVAHGVHEARDRVLAAVYSQHYQMFDYKYELDPVTGRASVAEEFKEDVATFMHNIFRDLEKEPAICDVVFVRGSE